MAPPKKITGYVKLQIEAAKATPAPPVGPALGQAQVNIMEFCKQFNARTQNKEMAGLIIPVVFRSEAAKATPAPPVGPALGQGQVNIMEFCKQFNTRTQNKEMAGLIIPVVISVYGDRSFSFVTKTPPAAVLLKKAAGVAKGSGTPNKEKIGKVTEAQVREIATQKMPDLNAASVDAAVKSIKGTARSMGIEVVA